MLKVVSLGPEPRNARPAGSKIPCAPASASFEAAHGVEISTTPPPFSAKAWRACAFSLNPAACRLATTTSAPASAFASHAFGAGSFLVCIAFQSFSLTPNSKTAGSLFRAAQAATFCCHSPPVSAPMRAVCDIAMTRPACG